MFKLFVMTECINEATENASANSKNVHLSQSTVEHVEYKQNNK